MEFSQMSVALILLIYLFLQGKKHKGGYTRIKCLQEGMKGNLYFRTGTRTLESLAKITTNKVKQTTKLTSNLPTFHKKQKL